MTINLAIEYIPKRMRELGYDSNYHIRFHHYVLQSEEKRTIEAFNEIFLLVEEAEDISVESLTGIFDLSQQYISEQQYEHEGLISLVNQSNRTRHVRFIQIIPSKKERKKKNSKKVQL